MRKWLRYYLPRLRGGTESLCNWARFFPIIILRAQGVGNRLRTSRYILHSLWAWAGLPCRPHEYRVVLDGQVFNVEAKRRDLGPYGSVWIDNEYHRDLRLLPPPGGTVIDVGAQVGFFTIRTARLVPGVRILAVEPDPDSHVRLQANVQANGVSNVTFLRTALGGVVGTVQFLQSTYSAESRIMKKSTPGAIEVPCTTLDRLVLEQRIEQIDLLKIDAEGAEESILAHGQDVALPRTRVAMLEVHGGLKGLQRIDQIMTACGLQRVGSSAANVHYYLRESK